MTELEPGYHRDKSNASGTDTYYTVECRCAGTIPIVVNGQAVTGEWSQVIVQESVIGVPVRHDWRSLCRLGRYTYEQAQAIRWWWIAEAAEGIYGHLVDTRLVKHETKWQSTTTAVESVDELLAFPARKVTE